MERLYFLAKTERGVADAEAGRVLPHQDVRTRFAVDHDLAEVLTVFRATRRFPDFGSLGDP